MSKIIKKEDLVEYKGLYISADYDKFDSDDQIGSYEIYDFGQITNEPICIAYGAGVKKPHDRAEKVAQEILDNLNRKG